MPMFKLVDASTAREHSASAATPEDAVRQFGHELKLALTLLAPANQPMPDYVMVQISEFSVPPQENFSASPKPEIPVWIAR